jgi:hypothetical protein
MTPRRGFLALVGATGAFTGSVFVRKAAAAPTLILPPDLIVPDGERPVREQPSEPEMQAVLDVKAGLSHAMFVDWLESGLRLVEDCKPGGGIFGAYWREAKRGQIPAPPRRIIGEGGRTPHEQAHLQQCFDNLQGSLQRQMEWSKALPIRQGTWK